MLLILILACAGSRGGPAPEPAPVPAAAPPAEATVAAHMAEHLARATATRDAVVQGRFDEAREGFRWLAGHEPLSAPGSWTADMQRIAATGMVATDTAGQAAALGALANTCGGCHQSLSTGVLMPERPAPPSGSGLSDHMARHAWASDRMWAALIEPDGTAWERSLRVLSPEGEEQATLDGWGLPASSAPREAAVHRLAHAALADDNPDTRADLYGQIVAECAGCHQLVRGEAVR